MDVLIIFHNGYSIYLLEWKFASVKFYSLILLFLLGSCFADRAMHFTWKMFEELQTSSNPDRKHCIHIYSVLMYIYLNDSFYAISKYSLMQRFAFFTPTWLYFLTWRCGIGAILRSITFLITPCHRYVCISMNPSWLSRVFRTKSGKLAS